MPSDLILREFFPLFESNRFFGKLLEKETDSLLCGSVLTLFSLLLLLPYLSVDIL